MMKNQNQTESLIQYVAMMHDRRDEYHFHSLDVISDLEEKETDVSAQMKEIFKGLTGNQICSVCNNSKMYDGKAGEYYCPIHEA